MAIRLSDKLRAGVNAHGAREYPHECCGALLGELDGDTKVVRALRPLENVHEDGHERRYLVAPDAMFHLEREARTGGQKVLGFYHSHPDHPARPSEYDRDWAWPWYSYIIVAVARGVPGDLTCWTLDEDRQQFSAEEILP